MAAGIVNTGTGATLAFGTSSYAIDKMGITFEGQERAAVDTTHLGTAGYKTYMAGDLVEGGTLTVSCHLDADDPAPIATAAETVTLTFPIPVAGGSAGATMAFTGFVTSFSGDIPLEDRMTATFSVKVADDITWTDHAT